ncbi:MAG: glycosyl transferase [Candidatus Cloacimonetes bacterium]|nr:glycosyl transferase [Candidatus Cloacimonadota bacterium]
MGQAGKAGSGEHGLRILLITYYFPPCGGAAVQRWLRFLPHLVENGCLVDVIAPEKADYPVRDNSLLRYIPAEVGVFRTPNLVISRIWGFFFPRIQMPYGNLKKDRSAGLLTRIALWLRINLIIPDIRIIWNRYAKDYAGLMILRRNYDVIITTGPPHSTHLLGMNLQMYFQIPWIADFRDPWSEIHYLRLAGQTKLAHHLHKRMERKVVRQASAVLTVSRGIGTEWDAGKVHVLYNGYEPRHFEGSSYQRTQRFRIKYIGQLTAGQDLAALVKYVIAALPDSDLEFNFIGTNLTEQEWGRIREDKPNLTFELNRFQCHAEALNEMVNAELLLLVINRCEGSKGILTTKLFEYCGSRTPVLCYGPRDGEAAQIISSHQAGFTIEGLNDTAGRNYIQELYEKWADERTVRTTADLENISVGYQVRELIRLLADITNSPSGM